MSVRIWCTKCDENMKEQGIALNHPTDGVFFVCPKCKNRIVIYLEKEV